MQQFKVPNNWWIIGATDSEGCFSVYIVCCKDVPTQVKFEFTITQKNPEMLHHCRDVYQDLLNKVPNLKNKPVIGLRYSSDSWNLTIRNPQALESVILPFFAQYRPLSKKFFDYLFFLKCFQINKDKTIKKHVKFLYITILMYQMNYQEDQRKRTLEEFKDLLKPYFGSLTEFNKECKKANKMVVEILKKKPPRLNDQSIDWPSYFCGLSCGDGCIGTAFDMRKKRNIKVRKFFGIYLVIHDRNIELMQYIAKKLFNSSFSIKEGSNYTFLMDKLAETTLLTHFFTRYQSYLILELDSASLESPPAGRKRTRKSVDEV